MAIAKKQEIKNKTKGKWLKKVQKEEHDDIPLLTDSFWSNAQIGSPLRKRLMSLRLDSDLIDWFKEQGPNYQTRMNQVLRTYMEFCKKSQ